MQNSSIPVSFYKIMPVFSVVICSNSKIWSFISQKVQLALQHQREVQMWMVYWYLTIQIWDF